MLLLLLITLTSALQCNELLPNKMYSVSDAFECIESVKINNTFTQYVQKTLQVLFETYVYKDILKSPPQPSFNTEFYTTVDIDERLKNLSLEETSLYKFMQEIQSIVNDAHDYHLSFRLSSNKDNHYYYDFMYAVLPFIPDIVDNEVVLYKNPNYETFDSQIPQTIIDNVNIPVTSINDMSPIDFIKKFASEQTFLKTPHGRFTYALETMSFIELRRTVMDKSVLEEPIKITYSNNQTVTINYNILYIPLETLSKEKQKRINAKRNGYNDAIITIDDFVDNPMRNNPGLYDYQSLDGNLACKIDKDMMMNVMILKTFYPVEEVMNFGEVMNTCISSFDNNEYPITIILPMNGGGSGDLVSSVQDTFAPQGDSDMIGSVRISKGTEGCIKYGYGSYLQNPENCQERFNSSDPNSTELGEWYNSPKITYYGTVEHKRTQESILHSMDLIKNTLEKHPRDPTDIIIMTDGFCYSACSVLTKAMVEQGNAIVVGYEGDPNGKIEEFDAGNSPTAVVTQNELQIPEADNLKSINGEMRISFIETFAWDYSFNQTIPREFLIHPVDERINLYKFFDNKLGQFIAKAKDIHAKYQNECNPNNKRLVKYSKECDQQISMEHAHGGFKCGDDGKWSNQCVAAYCDKGYKFDFYNQKCIVDTCEAKDESTDSSQQSESSENSSSQQSESSENSSSQQPEPQPPEDSSSQQSQSSEESSSQQTSSSSSNSTNDKTMLYIIIGCSVGGVLILLLLIIVVVSVIIYRKRHSGSQYSLIQ
ncbi:hypothetical protein EHI8A_137670 [Entamoeba histolytica HM-1:IMSS-B]|uniref:Uncharacterized protein n=4 Tax=Entamoeba histolytica TaxID=5759 RepID=C4M8X0_ENTH1|nr:hypothetical protein EHI_120590 [Entamoeba histolytica HM-1:IMSS]EAL46589.1 hypothetical protein EHI_120590 [Entamoeba histolytica HM-1:IMSS]EMH73871.1 hypothetical protein EHI8A_137670 [Entamoeba histolytica HM-1:IMSS-B]ENY65681.1 hypothetical protein EHI7A_031810 [Entamoeba histolytica HM-1:IMSS-A]GAT98071.1 hypothetical protein CL6EHI_120590 [Entamoeba histolytica]|eukprot:XP_651977.1 hypothetical protein EHI_120590 [Entamoeba histolytica HM-1:IMSS]